MTKVSGEPYRNVRLCIDSYVHGNPTGRYYQPGLEESARSFHSLTQLLVDLENMFDKANFPQSYTARRSFVPWTEDGPDEPEEASSLTGALGTFTIRLMFRQHASWQGTITWVEGRGEQHFRSVLELILLLDNALGGCA